MKGLGCRCWRCRRCWRFFFCIQRRKHSRDSAGADVCESFAGDSTGADVCNLVFEGERNVAKRGGSEKMHTLIAYMYRVVVTGCLSHKNKIKE